MRYWLGALLVLLLPVTWARADAWAYRPAKQDLGCFQGSLGKKLDIVMTLVMRDGKVGGSYRYAKYGSPITLESIGGLSDDFTLEESTAQGDQDPRTGGYFTGKIDANHDFTGTWTSHDGRKNLPFTLHRIAETTEYSNNAPRYNVKVSVPAFSGKSRFHTELNQLLAKQAKASVAASAAEFEKTTAGPDDDSFPFQSSTCCEILYADDSLVSLCQMKYLDAGGMHGTTICTTAVYSWQNRKIVELHNRDFINAESRAALDRPLLGSLKRQKAASPEDVQSLSLDDLNINPTADGLIFTFPPYAVDCYTAGTYTVMLPYKSVPGVLKGQSVLARFIKDSAEPTRAASVNP